MRVFISQPMMGLTDERIKSERERAITELQNRFGQGFDIIDSTIPNHEEMTALECFAESIKFLSKADLAVFIEGWENARGCRLENAISLAYGTQVLYV